MDMPTPSGSHRDPVVPSVSRTGVIGDPIMSLSSSGVSLTLPSDANPTAVDFKVRNTRSGLLSFQVLTDVPWLKSATSVGAALGDELGGDDATVRLTVNTSGLAPGQHVGRATMRSLYAAGSPRTFTVNLVVGDDDTNRWADDDCSGSVDPIDALLTMRHDAGLDTVTSDCLGMGGTVQIEGGAQHIWGDVDCSGEVNLVDALKILIFDAGSPVSQAAGCPGMGDGFTIAED
jgi:hypothetical protein